MVPGLYLMPFLELDSTYIDDEAFCRCPGLHSVVFSSTLEEIGSLAFCETDLIFADFSRCSKLNSIGESAFSQTRLTALDLSQCSTLKTIGDEAFGECSELQSVLLPQELERLESSAFCLSKIQTIVLPPRLKTLSQRIFFGCKELKSVVFPTALQTIKKEAFNGCSLRAVDLSASSQLKSIERLAFQENAQLETIVFPASLETLGEKTFFHCPRLQKIIWGRPPSQVRFLDFYGRNAGTVADQMGEVGIPDSCQHMGV